ncbi:MAG: phosphate acyltransferase PlsX [Bacteroidetes bacterium]|nr:phosphate acyltransferase PlsX [Bacteroidota bacterium]
MSFRIGIDLMGGDKAPTEVIRGIRRYLDQASEPAELHLFGDWDAAKPLLDQESIPEAAYQFHPTKEVIGMQEHPTRALKEKPDSSLSKGFQLLAGGQIDSFLSAGNTGAMLVGSLFSIQALEGVLRPTMGTVMPKLNGGTGLILDVGLNADCKPEHLNQFATMGTVYARHILEIKQPKVGLLNVGEEEGKGNLLAQATYPLLKENTSINFVGNIEGRDLMSDKADVMVCEGFTGNILLKMAESLYDMAQHTGIQHPFLDRFHFENYGGTPVLGVRKPVIVGHGISGSLAFSNMIRLAEQMLRTDILTKMADEIAGTRKITQ